MILTRWPRTVLRNLLSGGVLCIAMALPSVAQVQTQTSETEGAAMKKVTIERGEIVYVNGRSVVVKMEDGTLRHFDNVPESVTFNVDGKPVSIKDAKVGMKLEKQTITTTTPRVVTTVQTVTGKVWRVQAPNWVILTLDNNENQKFNIPKGQKFTINGEETDAFGLKPGMVVSAQKVVEVPTTVVAEQIQRTGTAPPPPPPPKADVPLLVVFAAPTPAPATETSEAAPTKLPTTASNLPLIGLLGGLLCVVSLGSVTIRRIGTRSAE